MLNTSFGSFIELHRGFHIQEVLGQADSVAMVGAMSNSGGGYFDPELHRYVQSLPSSAEDVLSSTPDGPDTKHGDYRCLALGFVAFPGKLRSLASVGVSSVC